MQLCFIDEAGDLGALRDPPEPNDQPVLVVAGLFVDAVRLGALTDDYLDLKHRFFPDLNYPSTRRLDRILPEIKGAKLRRNAIRGNARQTRRVIGFLDRIMGLLGRHEVYDGEAGRHVGGVVVSDYLEQRSGALMFGR